jgi:NADPH:quinone reductase
MATIRAVVVDQGVPQKLVLQEVEAPHPRESEALVGVHATSLNRGEVEMAMSAATGWRPGRDLAGIVLEPAADGTGPKAGSRVVGLRSAPGVWAEQVAVPTESLAEIPDKVSFAQAAALPVAGVTALRALSHGGLLLGKRVLITGSTGGVGAFAHQLATASGAVVVGHVRRASDVEGVKRLGAEHVVVGDDLGPAAAYGPFHLVLDSLGGPAFAAVVSLLAPGGTSVNIGWTAGESGSVDVMAFNRVGGASIYGLRLDLELRAGGLSDDLAVLANLVAHGRLVVPIEVEESWLNVADIAEGLLSRRFAGKAVLRVNMD